MSGGRFSDNGEVEPNKPLVRYWECDTCKAIIKEGSTPDSKPITIVLSGDRIVNTKPYEETRQTLTYHVCGTCYLTVLGTLKSITPQVRIVT